jgi:hypothetical protein
MMEAAMTGPSYAVKNIEAIAEDSDIRGSTRWSPAT